MHASWVEERLAALSADTGWRPDSRTGLARLRARRSTGIGRARRWPLMISAAAAVCLFVMVFPSPRALAQRCLDCSAALWQGLAASGAVRAEVRPEKSRRMAPDFTLDDASGNPVRLKDFRGKVVLLNFWATWCGGCKVEIPWFIEFQRTYRNRNFAVLGISMDEGGWKSVRPFINARKINYPVMIGGPSIAALYDIQAMPVTLMIDPSGRVAATHVGLARKSDYKAEIDALLNEKPPIAVVKARN
ncbi:MAG: peroxiredoxin family protein [Bryobacteraceae bacterium]